MSGSSKNIIEFTLVYNQYKAKLFNYTLKMVCDRMLTEDIVQNIFIKLFQNLPKIKNKESIKYWLFTTARNEIYTIFRNKKIHVDKYNVTDSDDIEIADNKKLESEYEISELREIILKELENLPAEQREVYYLKEYACFSYKEISAILQIDENLVKSRLFKTRQKLINRIGKILKES